MKRISKGSYGYRNYRKKIQMIELAVGTAMILAQLLARNFTDNQAARNILTVMAILTVLPVANVASPFFAAFPYSTPGKDFHKALIPYEEKCVILYDLIVTSKEQILPLDGIAVHPAGVCAYCSNPKTDIKKAESYLNSMFTAHRLDGNVRVINDLGAFERRLKGFKPASSYEDDGSVDYAAELLKNLSM
ncbi:MAG: O-linked GlcNAc transferase-like protein [Lachnospiraceae bacterium]|nr:O-linked GlcNAc transferase-like protein [Lachnospiraceae bacterium]